MPFVSVLILNYNGKRYLDTCLSSVLQTKYRNFEVIFVDNGSSDESSRFVKQRFGHDQKLRIITLSKNLGFAEGNNVGALNVNRNGKYLVFLNNDTKVDSEWLTKLVEPMESNPQIGIAQPKILSLSKPEIIDSTGGFINKIGLVRERGRGEKDTNQYNNISEVFYAKGAALIIRRCLWSKLGGFDPVYFLFWEDTDLCWRARLMGYKVVFVPDSVVYHFSSATANEHYANYTQFFDVRNRIITLFSNYNLPNLWRNLPLLLIYYAECIFTYDITKMKSPNLVYYKIKGLLWPIIHFKYLLCKRWFVQTKIRKLSDKKAIEYLLIGSTFKVINSNDKN